MSGRDPLRVPVAASMLTGESDPVDVTADVGFGETRAPVDTPAFAVFNLTVHATGGNRAAIEIDVDGVHRATAGVNTQSGALTGNPDAIQTEFGTLFIPKRSTYTIRNVADPNGTNAIRKVSEIPA